MGVLGMANQEHLDRLKEGTNAFNTWRKQFPDIRPDLRKADLRNADLSEADLSRANLGEADLSGAYLRGAYLIFSNVIGANLIGTNLSGANLRGAYLTSADLSEADLSGADLTGAFLIGTNLSGADLNKANLNKTLMVDTDLTSATLINCRVYGTSIWNVKLEKAIQENLVITPHQEATITVDALEVAQFIYLLVNNPAIRQVIDTIAKKAVLILGRFTPERKAILELLRDELRSRGYVPILFDFQKPDSKDLTETVSILAHLARFIIVDLTDPSSVPHELATIIPQCIAPVQPLLLQDDVKPRHEYAMFQDLRTRYHWVLPTYQYRDIASLLASIKENVIEPAEQKAQELEKR